MATVQKITPNLWFDRQAEEAAQFYTSIFPQSSIGSVSRYGKEGFAVHKMPEGTALAVEFMLSGQSFLALNGGPLYQFTEAISFVVHCDDQAEIDYYWEKLTAGGDERAQRCGWLKDKFGLSWQVVPSELAKLMSNKATAGRVMQAFLNMKKFDLAVLREAANG